MKTTIKIVNNERNTPQDKLADAELHFLGGELDGLKLMGFAIWRRPGAEPKVTFPARPFIVHGERHNFALVRAIDDANAEERLRERVLQAYLAKPNPIKTNSATTS
jgi:hypothetical protein